MKKCLSHHHVSILFPKKNSSSLRGISQMLVYIGSHSHRHQHYPLTFLSTSRQGWLWAITHSCGSSTQVSPTFYDCSHSNRLQVGARFLVEDLEVGVSREGLNIPSVVGLKVGLPGLVTQLSLGNLGAASKFPWKRKEYILSCKLKRFSIRNNIQLIGIK